MNKLIYILILIWTTQAYSESRCMEIMAKMLSAYKGEQLELVEYVHPEDLPKYKLTIKEGLLYNHRGRKTTTRNGILRLFKGDAIFVMDSFGGIYISEFFKEGYFHHSSFLAGNPVAMAGHIWIERGKVLKITNNSGHYKPSEEMMSQLVKYLEEKGVDLTDADIILR